VKCTLFIKKFGSFALSFWFVFHSIKFVHSLQLNEMKGTNHEDSLWERVNSGGSRLVNDRVLCSFFLSLKYKECVILVKEGNEPHHQPQ